MLPTSRSRSFAAAGSRGAREVTLLKAMRTSGWLSSPRRRLISAINSSPSRPGPENSQAETMSASASKTSSSGWGQWR